jgi:hypothetical protein
VGAGRFDRIFAEKVLDTVKSSAIAIPIGTVGAYHSAFNSVPIDNDRDGGRSSIA